MLAQLKNSNVKIEGHGLVLNIIYPYPFLAANAYRHIKECCDRFNTEPDFNPEDTPRIYAYGEMLSASQYLNRLMSAVEKIGATVKMESVEDN